jgi:hypothetical protein
MKTAKEFTIRHTTEFRGVLRAALDLPECDEIKWNRRLCPKKDIAEAGTFKKSIPYFGASIEEGNFKYGRAWKIILAGEVINTETKSGGRTA